NVARGHGPVLRVDLEVPAHPFHADVAEGGADDEATGAGGADVAVLGVHGGAALHVPQLHTAVTRDEREVAADLLGEDVAVAGLQPGRARDPLHAHGVEGAGHVHGGGVDDLDPAVLVAHR